jgi:hypothetical protein
MLISSERDEDKKKKILISFNWIKLLSDLIEENLLK